MKLIQGLLLALLLAGCNESRQTEPTKLAIVLATNAHDTENDPSLGKPYFDALEAQGFEVVSLTLPCHYPGEQTLMCWSERVAAHMPIFTDFAKEVSNCIDAYHADNVVIVGISRGAYAGLVAAARDRRVTTVAALMPVTDLWKLTEFGSVPVDSSYSLDRYLPALREKNILVRIGPHDDRVNTESALAFAVSVNATITRGALDGHFIDEDGSTAQWIKSVN